MLCEEASPHIHPSVGTRMGGPGVERSGPFGWEGTCEATDHAETCHEALADIAPFVRVQNELAGASGGPTVYDPYYCDGASGRRLRKLGFGRVVHEPEDFYARVASGTVPAHDVVVTNPPYSGDHLMRCVRWCVASGRPWFLLMPNYVATRKDYAREVAGAFYVVPRRQYTFEVPALVNGGAGIHGFSRISPFPTLWYCGGLPADHVAALAEWFRGRKGLRDRVDMALDPADIPAHARHVPPDRPKRDNPGRRRRLKKRRRTEDDA